MPDHHIYTRSFYVRNMVETFSFRRLEKCLDSFLTARLMSSSVETGHD